MLAVLAACGGSVQGRPPGPVAASAKLPLVTLNGTKVEMTSAIAYEDLGGVHMRVSSAALDCKTALDEGIKDVAGRTEFEVWVRKRLLPDGGFGWALGDTRFGSSQVGYNGTLLADSQVHIDVAPGHHSTIPVAETGTRTFVSGENTRTLVAWGDGDAIGCGIDRPPPRAQPANRDGAIAIGRATFPIAQAKFARTRVGLKLVLATGDISCGRDEEFAVASSIAPLVVELVFADAGLRAVRARLDGDWLAGVSDETRVAHDDAHAPAISARPPPGATQLDVALSGAGASTSRDKLTYAYSLIGQVTAQVCPDQLPP